MILRILAAALLLILAACQTTTLGGHGPPPPLPAGGPIVYSCADGTQLSVTFVGDEARIAVVGGVSMVLPNAGSAEAPYYTNGRYGLRGRGASASWEVGRRAPVSCRGG
jgi:membrane-bound inhibitor of C-type lysozyme